VTWTKGSVIQGKYRLEDQLGRGGQGVVWRAQHLHLDAPVAVKLMDAAFAADPGAWGHCTVDVTACVFTATSQRTQGCR
jgi:serine/threonine protein kinase